MINIGNHRFEPKYMTPSAMVEESAATAGHPLDSDETRKRFERVSQWFQQAISSQYDSRAKMAEDERFYDGDQWSPEDKQALQERGQPALVFNKIKPTIDWILGTERKSRVEAMVLARNKEKTPSAEAKTKLLKYIDDTNMAAYHRSHAFSNAVISGIGWLETGIKPDGDGEPLFVQHESWRNVWYDHLSTDLSMKDARYLFRSKWVDLDVAQAMYPDRTFELETEAQHTLNVYPYNSDGIENRGVGSYDEITGRSTYADGGPFTEETFSTNNRRLRVRLIECWYKETAKTKVCHCPDSPIHGSIMKEQDMHQQWAVSQGEATIVDSIKPVVRVMIYCGNTVLFDDVSPYRHNRFPFVPVWCFRRGNDNTPYGAVRNVIDPQLDLNKRRSKALHILNSNKFIVDENACNNWDEFRTEANRPDGLMRVAPNSRVVPMNESQIAAEQINLAHDDAQFIQDVSGVTDENMGRDTRAESGIAIRSKQTQGLVATSIVFDNLNFAIQVLGELQLSLIEQYYDAPKIVRLLNDKNAASYMSINESDEDNITNDKADFIVTQQDYRDTIRQSMFEMMSEFTTRLDPQTSLNMLDLVIDMSDLPGREQLVKRIRSMNGQSDPDAAVTPEQQAQEAQLKQQKDTEEQNQKAMQQKMAELELKTKEAEVALNEAKLDKLKAEAVVKSVEALYSAMQAAQTAATVPNVVPIADEIAKSAGFVDKNQAPIFQPPVQPQPQPQEPMAAMPQVNANTSPMFPPQPASAGLGLKQGIETPQNDGLQQPTGETVI